MFDWNDIIQQLKLKQKSLEPGDYTIMNIEGVIQTIKSDFLGGNQGHAIYFLENPNVFKEHTKLFLETLKKLAPEIESKITSKLERD